MKIEYRSHIEFPGWGKMPSLIEDIIRKYRLKNILEIGAGANPTLNKSAISDLNLFYTISDVDDNELIKADDVYKKVILDLSSGNVSSENKYDLVFSRMTGEHIKNGGLFHKNLYNLLLPGGLAVHCLSTLYAFPFVINRLFPENLSDKILKLFAPRDEYKHGKFKAYYSWARGPSKRMIDRFKKLGYEVVQYSGYFGHNYYSKIPVISTFEKIKAKLLLKYPLPFFTSYATIILKKPKPDVSSS